MARALAEAVAASSLGELCWVAESGSPEVAGVVALTRDDVPVIAFTYAEEATARAASRSARLVLALSESRSTGSSYEPLLIAGPPRLVEDPAGEVYVSDLVVQELRRYPPARLYADSPLLMREHWWYLPRLLVEIDVDSVRPFVARTPRHGHLLVVADGTTPVVRVASVVDDARGRLELEVVGGSAPRGPAVLFGQDASFPDLERWAQWSYRGRWDGTHFLVEDAPARTGLGRPPGLLARWRRQRALERRCVAAITRR